MSVTLQNTTMTIAHFDQPGPRQADLARRFALGYCYEKVTIPGMPDTYRPGTLVGLAAVDSFGLQPDHVMMFDEFELLSGHSAANIPLQATIEMHRILDASNADYRKECLNKVEATLTAQIMAARGNEELLQAIKWHTSQVAPAYPSVAISRTQYGRHFVVMPCQQAADDVMRYMKARLFDYLG